MHLKDSTVVKSDAALVAVALSLGAAAPEGPLDQARREAGQGWSRYCDHIAHTHTKDSTIVKSDAALVAVALSLGAAAPQGPLDQARREAGQGWSRYCDHIAHTHTRVCC